MEEVGDAADRGGKGGRQGEGDRECHVALRIAKAHLMVPRMGDNLIWLVLFHSVSLFYTLNQLKAHTVLDTGQVPCCEVKGPNNIFPKALRPLKQTKLADFPPRVGNVEVAGTPLAGDVLDGLHDQVRSTLGLLDGLKKRVCGAKSFFERSGIGWRRQATPRGAQHPYRNSQQGGCGPKSLTSQSHL